MITQTIKDKFANLNESNQNLIKMMAEKISVRGNMDFVKGDATRLIRDVSELSGIAETTVSRIFYTYIKPKSYEELVELIKVDSDNKENFTLGTKLFFRDKMIDAYESEGNFYFIINEILDVLPISKNNKNLKNAFAIRGRKVLEISGVKEQCIEVEKVKSFLQSFIRQLQEGPQRVELRVFLDSIHQLTATGIISNQPAFIHETPKKSEPVLEKKQSVEVVSDVIKTTSVVGSSNPKEEIRISSSWESDAAVESLINENEEIKSVIQMLNQLVFMSPESKQYLNQLIKSNGLVKTVIGVSQILNEVKDPSMVLMMMLENKLKECL